MTLEQLIYLTEANKYHSFTKAAETLYVSQSTISMSMAALEKELNLTLFNRSKKGISLTIHGEYILTCAQEILAQLNDIKRYATMYAQNMDGLIKIGVAQLFIDTIMPKMVPELIKTAPNLQIKLYAYDNFSIIDNIYTKKIHLGIIGYSQSQQAKISAILQEKNLSDECLLSCELKCYVNTFHPLARQKNITLTDILPYKIIIHEFSGHFAGDYLQKQGANLIEANNYSIISKLLENNDFIAILPSLFDFDEASNIGLYSCSQTFINDKVFYTLIRHDNENETLIEKSFITLVKNYLNSGI